MHWPNDREALRERYNAEGFVVVKQFCQTAEVEVLRNHLDRYISDVVPDLPSMDAFFEDKSARSQIRQLPRMQEHDNYFHELLTTGLLRQIAEHLCGDHVVPQNDTTVESKSSVVSAVGQIGIRPFRSIKTHD